MIDARHDLPFPLFLDLFSRCVFSWLARAVHKPLVFFPILITGDDVPLRWLGLTRIPGYLSEFRLLPFESCSGS